jgi:uncharacterized membrane protein YedE/YeeE
MRYLRMQHWSPYVVGALIGVLSWFAFASVDKPLGVSTAIARTTGMMENVAASGHVAQNPYFQRFPPAVDWEWMLVAGIALGALVSARLSGGSPCATADGPWLRRFGGSARKRLWSAFAGGALVMFGARLAGGCTSGHGISGSLQLAFSGWLFFAAVFASGLVTARLLFGKENARG